MRNIFESGLDSFNRYFSEIRTGPTLNDFWSSRDFNFMESYTGVQRRDNGPFLMKKPVPWTGPGRVPDRFRNNLCHISKWPVFDVES